MDRIVFGRTLVDGTPDDSGPRIEVDSDCPTLAKLREATGPLRSNPVTGEWGAGLVSADETDGEYSISLGIVPAGAGGPDEHVHPNCAERFVVVEGEVVFSVDGEDRTLTAGNGVTVSPGTPHTFRNDSDSLASFTVEIRPSDQTRGVITTLFGLAHEGTVRDDGQPKFLRGMVLADSTAEDTYFTSPPRPVMKVLTTIFAPIGRALGYRAIEPKYAEESFWREHVEQPDWDEIDATRSTADD
ncbi:hypothetical protein A4G99_12225 [Haladaptatus sp. R4]|uniref:cupin domain-containing protein n=1 Tax=Haladaptatus sp. R4 TaxID=1679489 RepID=UPI0007B4D410|nr:cupin domain-containing protein [Haladaptatus sp. R4]KZN23648.1 hypothetical protein A4G99_12225 [Haladaptatus sp. R4]